MLGPFGGQGEDRRRNLAGDVVAELRKRLGRLVLKTEILGRAVGGRLSSAFGSLEHPRGHAKNPSIIFDPTFRVKLRGFPGPIFQTFGYFADSRFSL